MVDIQSSHTCNGFTVIYLRLILDTIDPFICLCRILTLTAGPLDRHTHLTTLSLHVWVFFRGPVCTDTDFTA